MRIVKFCGNWQVFIFKLNFKELFIVQDVIIHKIVFFTFTKLVPIVSYKHYHNAEEGIRLKLLIP